MADDEVVFGCFGGLSPEKRLPQIVAAFSALQTRAPGMRLLLTGAIPAHYDLHADIERAGIAASTIVTGYLDTEEELNAHISACDVALNLRWPTAREISGPWLRCLAAGVPTVVTQLAHLSDVPSLDPRTWRSSTEVHDGSEDGGVAPVCIAIDILDEDHSLRLAMRRLARDAPLRSAVGEAGQAWWKARHTPAVMVEDYRRLIQLAMERPVPEVPLPPHLISDGSQTLHRVLEPFGLPDPLR
jgi:glycosyltransferase involved in cell wall biosynthesis